MAKMGHDGRLGSGEVISSFMHGDLSSSHAMFNMSVRAFSWLGTTLRNADKSLQW